MKQALILPGWPQKPTKHWYPWLKIELEKKGFSVFLPSLPTMYTKNPNLQKQLDYIYSHVTITPETVIIGHSLGTQLAMRIAENNQYQTMILVGGWDFNDLTTGIESFWETPINHKLIIKHTKTRVVLHADNDPYVTKLIAEEMSKRLKAKFVCIPKAGHFMDTDGYLTLPDVLKYIK